jgi:hypothetical protein
MSNLHRYYEKNALSGDIAKPYAAVRHLREFERLG